MSAEPITTPAATATTFQQLGLGGDVLAAIRDAGYETPTAIQAGAIPLMLANKDLIGQARTGTGKTAAFSLPMLDAIDVQSGELQGLVLTPTRELAIQITEAMEIYARHCKGLRVLTVYGGQSIEVQLRALRRGVHIVVGTPGRIMDHLRRKSLNLENVRAVVLDEADEMLRMGFIDDVEAILEKTPKERHTALFSATMPRAIDNVARRHLRKPERITIETKASTSTIEQRYIRLRHSDKFMALDRLLRTGDHEGVLIFAQRRADTEAIATQLSALGHRAEALNGDLSQQQREQVVNRLKEGTLNVVVGTDVAARGLDVDHLSLVINYDLPQDLDTYTHRIGRTGRAGREGLAVSLVTSRSIDFIRRLEKRHNLRIASMPIPSAEDVAAHGAEEHKARVRALLEDPDLLPPEHYNLVKSLVAEGYHMTQVAAAASALAAGDSLRPPTAEKLTAMQPASGHQPSASKPKKSSRRKSARRSKYKR